MRHGFKTEEDYFLRITMRTDTKNTLLFSTKQTTRNACALFARQLQFAGIHIDQGDKVNTMYREKMLNKIKTWYPHMKQYSAKTLYHHHLMSLDMVTHITQQFALPYILDHHYRKSYIKFEKRRRRN